ncbi:hypothetical protein PMIT1313_02577 [Prochlorococcus marinus str. MIT 1313]|nr:hypothetical protein PMIT1313_02577 [Prochlorococcus marinus str. MIT 1313]KZR78621.1 hypothetical protein PMIT1318_00005 [Prochlorococcus marinus str. MIT 1318]
METHITLKMTIQNLCLLIGKGHNTEPGMIYPTICWKLLEIGMPKPALQKLKYRKIKLKSAMNLGKQSEKMGAAQRKLTA